MSELASDIISYVLVGVVWIPFILGLLFVLVIFIIDAIKESIMKREFYNKLPYLYKQVIDSYNSHKCLFGRRFSRDCFVINSSEEFKQYEENTKKFVDEEL